MHGEIINAYKILGGESEKKRLIIWETSV
jgi:hypothetical protein